LDIVSGRLWEYVSPVSTEQRIRVDTLTEQIFIEQKGKYSFVPYKDLEYADVYASVSEGTSYFK